MIDSQVERRDDDVKEDYEEERPRFQCPGCGCSDAWKADYYEAVWQGVELLVGPDGQPEPFEYDGLTGSYDDGATENDRYVCQRCGHEIVAGAFVFFPADAPRTMTAKQAVSILFPPGELDPDAPWRSGADIAEIVASYFDLDHETTAKYLTELARED